MKTNLLKEETVVQLLSQLGEQEKHFNSIETQYRLMASGWLLATFGGIGFLLEHETLLPYNRGLLIGIVGSVGCAGIFLLWLLDIKVYHKLLNCLFLQGVYLEQTYPYLPKIRTDMLMSEETGEVTASTSLFYQASACLLIITSAAGFSLYFNNGVYSGLIFIIAFISGTVLVGYMRKASKSQRSKQLHDKIRKTYIDEVLAD